MGIKSILLTNLADAELKVFAFLDRRRRERMTTSTCDPEAAKRQLAMYEEGAKRTREEKERDFRYAYSAGTGRQPCSYKCPVCRIKDPTAYLRCNRPDCTDGRDPR